MCREHGQQLTELAASNKIDGFNLFGVIKETGVVRFLFRPAVSKSGEGCVNNRWMIVHDGISSSWVSFSTTIDLGLIY